ncbi:sensor histidine kinase [Niallia sp. NCCP-28]|uniref:sensor histidine kinase n=1 Tax=Niallia sp. NCCP-28 TaxID=2934712 RepID=UPI00208C2B7F|nr:sensor histidine kinase [Niallia sp. NCCP-28]GKU80824.1 sensor histidine kinase DesK [Niallia sp. NCCP-28]
MIKKRNILQNNTGISFYIWTLLTILPFYFIFHASKTADVVIGILLTALFFLLYTIAYKTKGWPIYIWTSLLIAMSIAATYFYSYVYFAFFLSYLIGNIKKHLPFIILYIVHVVLTSLAINIKFILQDELLLKQLPFVLIIWLGVILFPLTIYNRKKTGQLEEKLEDANKRISELGKLEERQRIARDLHDTLGQKLSLIGLKADLAKKLIYKDPEKAKSELKDVQQTARTALNEVRVMVSSMRGIKLKEEIVLVEQILQAADIKFICNKAFILSKLSPIAENILSMCLKEGVTNIVKHSNATVCRVKIEENATEVQLIIQDNGESIVTEKDFAKGHGLVGMRERLEFVNGSLHVQSDQGTNLTIKVPKDVKQVEKEGVYD